MARKKGLSTFNLSLIRYLMKEQSKTTTDLAVEIDVSLQHLSGVLNGQRTLSEDIGKQQSFQWRCQTRAHPPSNETAKH